MLASPELHPDAALLRAFGLGLADAGSIAEIEDHLEACAACCLVVQSVPEDGFVRRVRTSRVNTSGSALPLSGVSVAPAEVAVPDELIEHARYRVLKSLGAGGMGSVYLAEHQVMARRVALKVI